MSTITFTFGMTAYEQIWPVAEDHYGIITSAQAKAMGISRQNMVAMAESGRLERVGHGVYQVKHHVPGLNDVYALSVAIAGEDAYLRGASVLYMLGLTPANPSVMYLGTPRRIRRRFPKGMKVKCNQHCESVEFEGFEGIPCQPLSEALQTARDEGAVEADRIADAALAANEKGLLTDEECAKFQD
jgi:predicted transcriptional regulator of viral defense system